jgi:hypothetical protein
MKLFKQHAKANHSFDELYSDISRDWEKRSQDLQDRRWKIIESTQIAD